MRCVCLICESVVRGYVRFFQIICPLASFGRVEATAAVAAAFTATEARATATHTTAGASDDAHDNGQYYEPNYYDHYDHRPPIK